MRFRDALIAISVPVIWGLGLVVAKPAVDAFPPILLMALRFAVAALILVWLVPVPRRALGTLFQVALIGSTLQYGLTFNGLRYLDAGTTALIVQAEVPFCVLLAALWLREPVAPRKWLGMLIAFAGIFLITGEPRVQGQLAGVGLVLAGAAMWAVGQVMVRRLGTLGGVTAIAWISVFAAPQLLLASLLFESGQISALRGADASLWAAVGYLGVVMTALGYTCWYHVLGRYPVVQVAPFLLLLPATAVAGGALFLGEALTAHILLGAVVITAGVALIVIERRPAGVGSRQES